MENLSFLNRSYWRSCLSILVLCPLLVSCSTLYITYSTADWIVLWKLDGYFDLSHAQEKYLKSRIQALHVWHRHQQLSQYAQFLNHVDQCAKDGLTLAELESIFASVDNFRFLLAQRVAPSGAIFLATVTPSQILQLETVLSQDHRRLVSEVESDPEERLAKRFTATVDTVSSWVGDLSIDQEMDIRKWIEAVPDTTDQWLAHRKDRQAWLLALLRSTHDPMLLEQGLYQWLADWKTGTTPESLMALLEWREGVKKVVLEIDRILTPEQRVHFSRELGELMREIKGMAG